MRFVSLSVLSLVLTALFYLLWWQSPLLTQLDYKFYDRLIRLFPSSHSPDSTVVVEIDDKSLKAFGQWPWPRMITSELVNSIADAKPKSIVFDIVFSEKDRSSPDTLKSFYRDLFGLDISINGLPEALESNDRILADAMGRGVSVLPLFSANNMDNKQCFLPNQVIQYSHIRTEDLLPVDSMVCSLPIFQQQSQGSGHIHAIADKDGILRRLSLLIRHNDDLIPSLGMAAVAASTHETVQTRSAPRFLGEIGIDIADHHIKADRFSDALLYFYPKESYRSISAYDLLQRDADKKLLEGKIVFLGSSALGLDAWHTIGRGGILPGVYAHATLAENIINNDLYVQPPVYYHFMTLISFLSAVFLLFLMQRKRYLNIVILFFGISAASFAVTYLFWLQHIYISIGYFIVPLYAFLFVLGLLMFIIDYRDTKIYISDMKKATEQKRRLSSALERSESEIEYQKAMLFQQSKLAAMGEMIDNIAHQWRHPLNMLGIFIQDLEYDYRSGKVDEHYIRTMVKESMEQIVFMSHTIDDFRNFMKPNRENHPFDVNQAISEALQLLSGIFESNQIDVETEYSPTMLEVFGSGSEFKQVIINLLHNARDAIVEYKPPAPKITIRTSSDGNYGYIMIQDNGGGIASNVMERIFEPYFTTKEEGKGSGIGLYMSYSIIRIKMGGNISVANVDEGALFTLTIPLWTVIDETD